MRIKYFFFPGSCTLCRKKTFSEKLSFNLVKNKRLFKSEEKTF
jgi:hypothetical protein